MRDHAPGDSLADSPQPGPDSAAPARDGGAPDGGAFFFSRRFFPMWGAFVLGAFTDNMLKQALLIGLTFNALVTLPGVDDGAAIVPFAGALFPLAMMLFSPIAGQVADRYDTRRLFRLTKFVEFVLMCLAALGFLLLGGPAGALAGPLLLLALFLMGVQSAFFSPVRIAAMPKYLHRDELIRGNAFCNGGLYTSILLGLLLGGALIELPNGPAMVGGVLAVMALAGWQLIRLAPSAPADDPGLKIDWDPVALIVRLIRQVAEEPPVLRPMAGIGLFFLISTAVTIAVPIYAAQTLNADSTVANLIMGLFVIGAMIGAVISAMLSRGRSGLGFATSAMVVAAGATVALYLASVWFRHTTGGAAGGAALNAAAFFSMPAGWLLAGLFMICAAAMGVYTVPLQAAVQRRARRVYRARIMAAGNIVNAIAAMAGSLSVTSVTATALAPHQAFLGIAVLQGAIALYMIRRRSSVAEGLYDEMLESGEAQTALPPDTVVLDGQEGKPSS